MLDIDWTYAGPLGRALETYASDAFGASLVLEDAILTASLPFFIGDRYRFWRGRVLDRPAVFMVLTDPSVGHLASLEKHRDLVRRESGADLIVLVAPSLSAETRRRLVEARIAFAIPGAQIYIPEAFFDLRSSGSRNRAPADVLSPTAQVLVLARLLDHPVNDESLTTLADRYETAVMSMSRALDELEGLHVCRSHLVGRQRRLMFVEDGRALWTAIEQRLQSPVRKVRVVRGNLPLNEAPAAGESALARYSMLASPRVERRALPASQWKRTARRLNLEPADEFDDNRTEVETWSYDPAILSRSDLVDPLSLYLSVRDNPDERIQQAARSLLEQPTW